MSDEETTETLEEQPKKRRNRYAPGAEGKPAAEHQPDPKVLTPHTCGHCRYRPNRVCSVLPGRAVIVDADSSCPLWEDKAAPRRSFSR